MRKSVALPLFLAGNCIRSCVKVSWMWPFPASSPWTAATPHLPPPLLIRPLHPPPSPPTPAPLPNWGGPFTWALSPGCKHTNGPLNSSLLAASPRSVLTPKLFLTSSTCQRADLLIVPCISCLKGVVMQILRVMMVTNDASTRFCFLLGDSETDSLLCHRQPPFISPRQINGALMDVELLQPRL